MAKSKNKRKNGTVKSGARFKNKNNKRDDDTILIVRDINGNPIVSRNPKSKERINNNGEIFTPAALVNEMLDKLPNDAWGPPFKETILDPTAGNGNFLIAALERCLAAGDTHENALSRIYGVELMQDNVDDMVARLDPNNEYKHITDKNIVCADSLKYHCRFDGTPCCYDDFENIFDRYCEKILDAA